jgi:hypothetical protein
MTNRMSEHLATENLLGSYLRDRRMKLDPAALGQFIVEVVRRIVKTAFKALPRRYNVVPPWI